MTWKKMKKQMLYAFIKEKIKKRKKHCRKSDKDVYLYVNKNSRTAHTIGEWNKRIDMKRFKRKQKLKQINNHYKNQSKRV